MPARGGEYGMDDGEAAQRIAAWTGTCDGESAMYATACGLRRGDSPD
ncbi:hypothetical protein RKD26_000965 [Streptomyces calvus]